jgi:hypothetical protein
MVLYPFLYMINGVQPVGIGKDKISIYIRDVELIVGDGELEGYIGIAKNGTPRDLCLAQAGGSSPETEPNNVKTILQKEFQPDPSRQQYLLVLLVVAVVGKIFGVVAAVTAFDKFDLLSWNNQLYRLQIRYSAAVPTLLYLFQTVKVSMVWALSARLSMVWDRILRRRAGLSFPLLSIRNRYYLLRIN